MEMLPLGKKIEGEFYRDAIHLACAPVIAQEELLPGEHVGFVSTKILLAGELFADGYIHKEGPHIGVVDPFLPAGTRILKGERVWLCIYPGTVTGLRHVWTHAAFKASLNRGGQS